MEEIVKQLLTGKDNKTHDIGRWMIFISFIVGLGLEVYSVVGEKVFDLQQFGVGVGVMLAGFGAGTKLKETTEPKD
jgi:hypothetical protein